MQIIAIALLTLIGIISAAWVYMGPGEKTVAAEPAPISQPAAEPLPTTPPTNTGTVPPTNTGTATASAYKDGTYTSEGSYGSPAGNEKMDVTLTLKAGIVTDVKITPKTENPVSKNFQDKFAAGIGAEVVGKSLDSISVDVVNGSSLTPAGFMEALLKIKLQAAM